MPQYCALPECNEEIDQPGSGPRRKFCSAAHRTAARSARLQAEADEAARLRASDDARDRLRRSVESALDRREAEHDGALPPLLEPAAAEGPAVGTDDAAVETTPQEAASEATPEAATPDETASHETASDGEAGSETDAPAEADAVVEMDAPAEADAGADAQHGDAQRARTDGVGDEPAGSAAPGEAQEPRADRSPAADGEPAVGAAGGLPLSPLGGVGVGPVRSGR